MGSALTKAQGFLNEWDKQIMRFAPTDRVEKAELKTDVRRSLMWNHVGDQDAIRMNQKSKVANT